MKIDNFKRKASKAAIKALKDKCSQKYNMDNIRAERYVDFTLDCVARAQNGESIGFSEEGSRLYYDYAMNELITAKEQKRNINKRLKFLVKLCLDVNKDFLKEVCLEKGVKNNALNVYDWQHIFFSNGDVLFSSCGGGCSYDLNVIYKNFFEFLDIVISANPIIFTKANKEAIIKGLDEQSKRMNF